MKPMLSHKQKEVLHRLAGGFTYRQIADDMQLSIHTVRNHVRRIYKKLGVSKCAEAVAKHI